MSPTTVTAIHRCDKHPEKVQYRTIEAAFDTAERRAPAEGVPIYVYACDHCGYFHLSKKKGTENIGRAIMSRKDAVVWATSIKPAPPPDISRDERWVDNGPGHATRDAIRAALHALGDPDEVTPKALRDRTGFDNQRLRAHLLKMGWLPTGATVSRVYVNPRVRARGPATTPPEARGQAAAVEPAMTQAPVVVPEWVTVRLDGIRDLTLDQLVRAYQAMGQEVQVRTR